MITSSEIEQHTREYLANGGTIKSIPIGVISDMWRTKSEIKAQENGTTKQKGKKGTKNQKQQFHLTTTPEGGTL